MMKTYKITFNMSAPIAMQQTIMFDGIIAYAYFQEHGDKRETDVGRLSIDNVFDFSGMPIRLHEDGYYMASWMFFDEGESAEQVHTMLKKWDEENDHMAEFGKAQRGVHIDRGEFKTTQIPIRVLNVPRCWFYFQSDNPKKVSRLIDKHIAGIGKKISRGYGFFTSYNIEECEDLFEERILRPIPAKEHEVQKFQDGAQYTYTAWRPPYWLPENFTMCRVK